MWHTLTEAEDEFLKGIYRDLYKFLTKLAEDKLYDGQNAEDIVQETFITASINVKKLMQSENPRGWLVNTLKYKAARENRARMRFYQVFQEVDIYDMLVAREDAYDFEFFDILGKPEYKVLRLIIVDGYDAKEAAVLLGISYEACRKRIQTAKRQFEQEFSY